MHGTNQPSNSKTRADDEFKNGRDCSDIRNVGCWSSIQPHTLFFFIRTSNSGAEAERSYVLMQFDLKRS